MNICAKCHAAKQRTMLYGREFQEVSCLTFLAGGKWNVCVEGSTGGAPMGQGAGWDLGQSHRRQWSPKLTLHLGLQCFLPANIKPDTIKNASFIISILFHQRFSLYSNNVLESTHPSYHSQGYLRKGTLCHLHKLWNSPKCENLHQLLLWCKSESGW